MHKHSEPHRRALCSSLAAKTIEAAPKTHHDKWLHYSGPPPPTPSLPVGSVWGLLNGIKVLHQYTEILSEAACGQGPHAHLLHAKAEACVRGLEWMAPLLTEAAPLPDPSEYHRHIDLWRASNPGLFGNSEAMFHTHQAYVVEDLNMTRLLVNSLLPNARNYDVALAANLLRTRPNSFDEFNTALTAWRSRAAYHPLILAALHMPRADQWAPQQCLHEADDWQALLDDVNRKGFVSEERLADVCERLSDRSPSLQTSICCVLDRVCALLGVLSHSETPSPLPTLLKKLEFKSDPKSPYTHSLLAWTGLKSNLEGSIPPSLLCHASHEAGRDGWGYARLQLALSGQKLLICPGPLKWVKKSEAVQPPSGALSERFHDMLVRMGDAATGPEMAHLMLQPQSLCCHLSGLEGEADLGLITDRARVLEAMSKPPGDVNPAFLSCVQLLVSKLPEVTPQTFPTPLSLLAWRVDCPQPTIVYVGQEAEVDLSSTPPHILPKLLFFDKMPRRSLSGISVLSDRLNPHDSLRSVLTDEILRPHPDFAAHPFHQSKVSSKGVQAPTPVTTTTLAETAAVFTGPKPANHTTVMLHQSKPWEEDHVDDRYAETQTAFNGTLYRDWVSMYRMGQDHFMSRLCSHHVKINQLFHTHFPISSQGKHSWVSVASTLPSETRVLRDLGGKDPLDSLRRSVENRFMHDTKLLPTWHPEDTVDASSVSVYSDPSANQVLLVYAPVSSDCNRRHFEVMSFRA